MNEFRSFSATAIQGTLHPFTVSDPNDKTSHASHAPGLHWVPRHGLLTRFDRTLVLGDAVFRWHSRLDGTAVLYGPIGKLAIGDAVEVPAGHLHRAENQAPRIQYVITRSHETGDGHVWFEAARRVTE